MERQIGKLDFESQGYNVEYAESKEGYILFIPKTAKGRPSHGADGKPGKSLTFASTPGKFGFNVPGAERMSLTVRLSQWAG